VTQPNKSSQLEALLSAGFSARSKMLSDLATQASEVAETSEQQSAFRIFNGMSEGYPELVLDIYGRSLVLHDHRREVDQESGPESEVPPAEILLSLELAREHFPFLETALWKTRHSLRQERRNGRILLGEAKQLARRVIEDGVHYTIDLRLNRDASFYLDTRGLRAFAKKNLADKRVLNLFAYTGSLGVAAKAGQAGQVIQTDHNRKFLNLAKVSYGMNMWPVNKADFRIGDFFETVNRIRKEKLLFDCVILDPPFFSVTTQGRIDLENSMEKLINKVKPLVAHEGLLIAVNNGVFVSGQEYQSMLEALCEDGYMSFQERIPVPEDVSGAISKSGSAAVSEQSAAPADPAPYNHSTKIAVLKLARKDKRIA